LKYKKLYMVFFLQTFISLIHWSHFSSIMFWAKKVIFWGETYLHSLNNKILVERSLKNLYCTNLSKLIQESIQILMNENNNPFYPWSMFEFIHHPNYGCCNHWGLNSTHCFNSQKRYPIVKFKKKKNIQFM
jgi:hypothetical protein